MPIEATFGAPVGCHGSPCVWVKLPPRFSTNTSVKPFGSLGTRSEASDSKAMYAAPWPFWANTELRLGPLGKPPLIERLRRWVSRSFVGSKALAEVAPAAPTEAAASAMAAIRQEEFTRIVVGGTCRRL